MDMDQNGVPLEKIVYVSKTKNFSGRAILKAHESLDEAVKFSNDKPVEIFEAKLKRIGTFKRKVIAVQCDDIALETACKHKVRDEEEEEEFE